MCGIFGVVGYVATELATTCVRTLAHRGPDGEGLWHTDNVTLGHRRLSILDLSEQAKQPMAGADGRYRITYNGEIYNFLELRRELESKGHRFTSESDTEVILAAFAEWGEDCQQRFNGMWAFAIWDTQENALFLSRDRFGKKPLYFAWLPGGRFAFASEMKALFPLLGELRPNLSLVRDISLTFSYESTEECVVQGISRFLAGHSGWLRDGRLEMKRWWCTLDHLHVVSPRYEEQVEQFRELFLDACRLRMRSDVPLGTALSGGLDSSATISAMAYVARHGKTQRMGESWQHAFVASFPGSVLDETDYACKVADHLGIEATLVEIDPLRAVVDLDRDLYLFEELYNTSPIPFMLTYGAIKAHGISVTLDGHGADELFGGYPSDILWALLDAGWNVGQVGQILQAYHDSQLEGSGTSGLRQWLRWRGRRLLGKVLRRYRGAPESPDSSHRNWQRLDHLNRRLYAATHDMVLPTLLRNYDRYSMANGVEIRMPFMDHRVVSMAFSLPWSSKVRAGYTKAIVRDAMAPFMPREIAYRKTKIGFNTPIVEWMKGPLKPYFLDVIASRSFMECDLVDAARAGEAVRQVIDDPAARFSDGVRAWKLIMPYLWERAVLGKREAHADIA